MRPLSSPFAGRSPSVEEVSMEGVSSITAKMVAAAACADAMEAKLGPAWPSANAPMSTAMKQRITSPPLKQPARAGL